MKLTFVLEYLSIRPLLLLLHPARRHEAGFFQKVTDELKWRRFARRKLIIMAKDLQEIT